MSSNLLEGLRHGDLKDCVYDLVTIDDFLPKMGEENEIIVVTFYCKEDRVADDLKRFLEKSFIRILDVEVSPNPDETNRYLVFVEVERGEDFFNAFESLLKEVSRTMGDDVEWNVKPYFADQIFKVSNEAWKEYVITDPKEYMSKDEFEEALRDTVVSFFDNSDFDDIDLKENKVIFSKFKSQKGYIYEGIVSEEDAVGLFNSQPLASFEDTFLSKSLGSDVESYSNRENHFIKKGVKVLVLGKYE